MASAGGGRGAEVIRVLLTPATWGAWRLSATIARNTGLAPPVLDRVLERLEAAGVVESRAGITAHRLTHEHDLRLRMEGLIRARAIGVRIDVAGANGPVLSTGRRLRDDAEALKWTMNALDVAIEHRRPSDSSAALGALWRELDALCSAQRFPKPLPPTSVPTAWIVNSRRGAVRARLTLRWQLWASA